MITDNHIKLALVIMTALALPMAIKYDHYVALLVWLLVFIG